MKKGIINVKALLAGLLAGLGLVCWKSLRAEARLDMRPEHYGMTAGDMYVLAYLWTAEACHSPSSSNNLLPAGCNSPKTYWKTSLTIHGLWPQYSSGGYPSYCTKEAFNASIPHLIGWNDMTTYWPDINFSENDSRYGAFWEHEWIKHGTCTGLDQYTYFTTTLNMLKYKFITPKVISENIGLSVQKSVLIDALGGLNYVSLQCESEKHLSGVYTCWKQVNGFPVAQIQCPSDVIKEETCTGDRVMIDKLTTIFH